MASLRFSQVTENCSADLPVGCAGDLLAPGDLSIPPIVASCAVCEKCWLVRCEGPEEMPALVTVLSTARNRRS